VIRHEDQQKYPGNAKRDHRNDDREEIGRLAQGDAPVANQVATLLGWVKEA